MTWLILASAHYRSELERLWPHWSFKGVDEEIWWLDHAEDKSNPKAVIKESDGKQALLMKVCAQCFI